MVAGHSLGEYAALMSAGMLDMDGALRASTRRGTEMGSVVIDDKGLMASVMAYTMKWTVFQNPSKVMSLQRTRIHRK